MKVQFQIWEDLLEEEMPTYSIILDWEIPWTEKSGGVRMAQKQLSKWAQSKQIKTKNKKQKNKPTHKEMHTLIKRKEEEKKGNKKEDSDQTNKQTHNWNTKTWTSKTTRTRAYHRQTVK